MGGVKILVSALCDGKVGIYLSWVLLGHQVAVGRCRVRFAVHRLTVSEFVSVGMALVTSNDRKRFKSASVRR